MAPLVTAKGATKACLAEAPMERDDVTMSCLLHGVARGHRFDHALCLKRGQSTLPHAHLLVEAIDILGDEGSDAAQGFRLCQRSVTPIRLRLEDQRIACSATPPTPTHPQTHRE
jgi:hypothetical protein